MKDKYNRDITYMRLSVTDLCNLRCRYCMPEDGVCKKSHMEMLTEDEMVQAVRLGAEFGINKVRITGGDPLVKKNIASICERIHNIDGVDKLCMTTNGLLLPELGRDLLAAGVEYLNISLDTLKADKYNYITRLGNLGQALRGIEAALELGFRKVKLNTVLIGGFNDDEIRDFVELTMKYPIDVRFIELMPMLNESDNEFGPEAYIPGSRVLEAVPEAISLSELNRAACGNGSVDSGMNRAACGNGPVDSGMNRAACGNGPVDSGSVAREYMIPGALGRIGLINPLSHEFCGSCNRIRLTADGKLKPCLHSNQEINIKGLGEADMRNAIRDAILSKPEHHPPLAFDSFSEAGRNMNEIGG